MTIKILLVEDQKLMRIGIKSLFCDYPDLEIIGEAINGKEAVEKSKAEIEEIRAGKIFEAEITETNKGGLTGKFGSYSVFIPASQIKLGFVKDLEKYVGKTLRLKAEKVK